MRLATHIIGSTHNNPNTQHHRRQAAPVHAIEVLLPAYLAVRHLVTAFGTYPRQREQVRGKGYREQSEYIDTTQWPSWPGFAPMRRVERPDVTTCHQSDLPRIDIKANDVVNNSHGGDDAASLLNCRITKVWLLRGVAFIPYIFQTFCSSVPLLGFSF